MFHLPLNEIRKRFRLSEMVILAWRSQEQVHRMKRRYPTSRRRSVPDETPSALGDNVGTGRQKKSRTSDAFMPEGLSAKYFNEEGELDLRRVTGREAYRYFQSIGIQLPIIQR
jgi:hypothetical protein